MRDLKNPKNQVSLSDSSVDVLFQWFVRREHLPKLVLNRASHAQLVITKATKEANNALDAPIHTQHCQLDQHSNQIVKQLTIVHRSFVHQGLHVLLVSIITLVFVLWVGMENIVTLKRMNAWMIPVTERPCALTR